MTAKEYLSQALHLDHRIDSKIEQIASLNALATKCTSAITGMPHNPSPSQSTMADAICKIVDLQELLKKDLSELVDLKREIMTVIDDVGNDEYKALLEKRYLCFQPFEQIAVNMGYSIQHTFRLHDKALKEIVVPS
ncbi:MAG: DUF1492 domain-containing protein [Oscillospiraceae bacterium]|nr:DUF1492 domain-containing protein [Oscillospiraceae bacterium]